MNFSQLFYQLSYSLSQKRAPLSQPQLPSTQFGGVPDAPVSNEAPIVPTAFQGTLDFQPSQLFHKSPQSSKKHTTTTREDSSLQFDKSIQSSHRNPFKTPRSFATITPVKSRVNHDTDVGSDEDLFESRDDSLPVVSVNDKLFTPAPLILPRPSSHGIKLRSVEELPEKYRGVFKSFPYFNIVQSKVFDDVFYTDKSLVVCAPTGAGKTVVFELAIIRLVMKLASTTTRGFKVVYMAPIKALCSERYQDWADKFESFGLKCKELTGDTEIDNYYELQEVNIILTTPEKWDSMTRRWRDNKCMVQSVCLFLIDEIHVLNDNVRGATIEAVISRMKTVQASMSRFSTEQHLPPLRFIAVSATIPNIEDIAEWMGQNNQAATFYKMDESLRPVRLRKVVLGFPFDEQKGSGFHFDMSLSYKLGGIINTYAEGKPTLVFCSTRKGTQQAADILAKDSRGAFVKDAINRQVLMKYSNLVKDLKLRDTILKGIGIHHAGMDMQDRKYMEELFASSQLLILVATSTLAMGVNLPAHLVILKSTQHYNMGMLEEYSNTQVLQMIGRAGRPQFDTTATAVIMTKTQNKMKYESLLNGTQMIESSLHRHLIEHLNAEIVLQTISDMAIAMEWVRYTYLYIRVMKNPKHYGMPTGLTREQTETRLQELCMRNLNQLAGIQMIKMNGETFDIQPTEAGRLMARYCIAFETMKKFCGVEGEESISDLLEIVSGSEEFMEVQLRVNEKKTLNSLNKDKNRQTIRYQLPGKIKTKQMKVNCLIQAQLSCLLVQDFALQQDMTRIFRAAQRLSRCLMEVLWIRDNYKAYLSAAQLCKAIKARLWENSKHVAKQLDRIGPALSTALVNAGVTSFQKIEETNPRELELIVNRHPPFGNQVRDSVAYLPKYELTMEQVSRYNTDTAEILIHLTIANQDSVREKTTASPTHTSVLLVANADNKIIFRRKLMDSYLLKESGFTKKLEVRRAAVGSELYIHLISQDWVGLDVQTTYSPFYLGATRISNVNTQQDGRACRQQKAVGLRPCNHRCYDKSICGHKCCNSLTQVQPRLASSTPRTPAIVKTKTGCVSSYMSSLKNKLTMLPETLSAKRFKVNSGTSKAVNMDRFAYTPRKPENLLSDDNYNITKTGHAQDHDWSSEGNNQSVGAMRGKSPNPQYTDWAPRPQSSEGNNQPVGAMSGTNPQYTDWSPRPQPSHATGDANKKVLRKDLLPLNPSKPQCSDWAQLDMYQKRREEYLEDQETFYQADDYELPDLDVRDPFSPQVQSRRPVELGSYGIRSQLFPSKIPSPHMFGYDTQTHADGTLTYSDTIVENARQENLGTLNSRGQSFSYHTNTAVPSSDNDVVENARQENLGTFSSHRQNFAYHTNKALSYTSAVDNSRGYGKEIVMEISDEELSPNKSDLYNKTGSCSNNTGHRYGQVVAWSNSQKSNKSCPVTPTGDRDEEDQWSGSDNDLLVVDDSPSDKVKRGSVDAVVSPNAHGDSLGKLVRPARARPNNHCGPSGGDWNMESWTKSEHKSFRSSSCPQGQNNGSRKEDFQNNCYLQTSSKGDGGQKSVANLQTSKPGHIQYNQLRSETFQKPVVQKAPIYQSTPIPVVSSSPAHAGAVITKPLTASTLKPASFFTTEEKASAVTPEETFSSIFDGIF